MAGVGGPQSPLDMKPDTATLLNAAGFGPGSLGSPNSPGEEPTVDFFQRSEYLHEDNIKMKDFINA